MEPPRPKRLPKTGRTVRNKTPVNDDDDATIAKKLWLEQKLFYVPIKPPICFRLIFVFRRKKVSGFLQRFSDSMIFSCFFNLLLAALTLDKLNFKFPHGGEEVKWHQDIQFWPHTNYDLITIGVYLEDVVKGQGEMGFIPRSHSGPLFDQYEKDIWRGYIQSADLPDIQAETAIFPTGKAGTVTIHNCRTIHGSYPNHSSHRRPLLLQTYSAADAFAYTDLVRKTKHGEHIIRGKVSRWARHDPRPCLVPPTKVGTIFQAQQKEI